MSIHVQPKLFADALARAMAATERSKEHPVLGHVLLTTTSGALALRSTDLNVEITTTLECEGDLPPFCAPADRLQNAFARLVDRGSAEFSLDGQTLTVSSGRMRSTIPTLAGDVFPSLQMNEIGATFTMDGKDLAALFDTCQFAISTKDTGRYYLQGLHLFAGGLNQAGDFLGGVASDGHKLAAREVPAELPDDLPSIIVPRKSVQTLAKLVAPWNEVYIEVSPTRLVASFGTTRYVTKLIEATYPDWRRLIPRQSSQLSFDSDRLDLAIGNAAAAIQADKNHKALMIAFGVEETEFSIANADGTAGGTDACTHNQIGDSVSEVTIGVDHHYLQEAIAALRAETIEVAFIDAASPILLRCTGLPDRFALIMPRRA